MVCLHHPSKQVQRGDIGNQCKMALCRFFYSKWWLFHYWLHNKTLLNRSIWQTGCKYICYFIRNNHLITISLTFTITAVERAKWGGMSNASSQGQNANEPHKWMQWTEMDTNCATLTIQILFPMRRWHHFDIVFKHFLYQCSHMIVYLYQNSCSPQLKYYCNKGSRKHSYVFRFSYLFDQLLTIRCQFGTKPH